MQQELELLEAEIKQQTTEEVQQALVSIEKKEKVQRKNEIYLYNYFDYLQEINAYSTYI